MDKKFGYSVFGGMLIGAFFGLMWASGGNPLAGLAVGTLIGTSLGWFIGAALLETQKKQKK